jgi:hypothetical protein
MHVLTFVKTLHVKIKNLTLQKVSQKTLSQMRYACENQKLNFTKGVVTKYITNKQLRQERMIRPSSTLIQYL